MDETTEFRDKCFAFVRVDGPDSSGQTPWAFTKSIHPLPDDGSLETSNAIKSISGKDLDSFYNPIPLGLAERLSTLAPASKVDVASSELN